MNENLNKVFLYKFLCLALLFGCACVFVPAQALPLRYVEADYGVQNPDTINNQATQFLQINEGTNNPFLNPEEEEAVTLPEVSNMQYTSEYDPTTGLVHFYRKIGNVNVKLPYTMTLEEYMDEDLRKSMLSYWDQRARGGSEEDGFSIFNPSFNLNSEMLGNIFGSDVINIKPQGVAELKIGVTTNKIDNPTLQENLRKTTTFDFQEKIQMNIQGNIGDKLKLGINYNTEATFEFENQMSLEYEGKEDDILQSVEAGNVTMSLPGTLITGSQNLFGVKTEMQFGKLSMTSVFSQQKGETSVIDIQGGGEEQEFEIEIADYDKNRHFFLSNFFRDLYDDAQSTYPIYSKITIQKVEIWVTNRTGSYDDSRDIVAFADIGETGTSNMINHSLWGGSANTAPSNDANNLYDQMNSSYSAIRDINQVTTTLSSISGFTVNKDYEKVESARLLSSSEYVLNETLGFVSLTSTLTSDEVLGVAFEYDYNGSTYQVGEFSSDNSEDKTQTLFVKLLKSSNLTPKVKPTWDLMMKNIYAIGAYQVESEDFVLDIACIDDSTGAYINYFPDECSNNSALQGKLLLRVMDLDRLDDAKDPTPDGVFDFVEDQTIIPDNGRVIFPMLEPFGSYFEDQFNGDQTMIDKYVYQSLYDSTQTVAKQNTSKNQFLLRGTYKSSVSSEISLNTTNISEGSVIVTAGGITLTENVDYTVDYSFGTVKILNQGLLASGTAIQITVESTSLFNTQTKTMLGTHLNYQFNDNFNLGATIMHLNERPTTQKVSIGDEPISNTIFGFNSSYYSESQWLTNALNKVPLINAKEASSITFEGEYAQLIPGTNSAADDQAYLDDFEGTSISIDIRTWTAWSLASTPQDEDLFPESSLVDDLGNGYNRAKLAWYTIDPLFARNNSYTPQHIKDDPDEQSNHYSRIVYESEVFPNRESVYGQPTNISVLNLAYYPFQRGPYNFTTTGLDEDGNFTEPEDKWAGITRRIETSDFEAANVEYIEFWMMDPFIYNQDEEKAGDLYFNLGSISEDVLRDSRKFFEQGLPGEDSDTEVDETAWGYVPQTKNVVDAFDSDAETRLMQDVGFNGMNSDTEKEFYSDYINAIETLYGAGGLTAEAYNTIMGDPASDDYHYYRGSDYDEDKVSILDRYKDFNGPEGNSVPSEYSPESYATAATTTPDMEDINDDNTLSESESYYQYKVHLSPDEMTVGQNYIVDKVTPEVTLKNGKTETVTWYQFRIPIDSPDKTVGDIEDVTSIRFMRMFLKGFQDTTILRFATLDLVRSDWRTYDDDDLEEDDENVVANSSTTIEVSSVNIEENASKTPVGYVLPPGIDRVIDPSNPQLRQLNEQSLLVKVTDVAKNDRQAVYKTMSMDLRPYGRLKMFVHAEEEEEGTIGDNRVRAFIRLGTDATDNYYEYEIPLTMTEHGATDRYVVWPEENDFDFEFETLTDLKLERNDNDYSTTKVYSKKDGDNWAKVKGNPNLGNVKIIMLGVRSMVSDKLVSFETWFNELRLTDFDEDGGYAANGSVNIKLSDLGSITMAGSMSTAGFGSIDQSVSERSQEDYYQYDIATNLDLGKLTGENSRLTVPFYYSQSREVATPKYYTLDPDILLKDVLDNADSQAEKDSIKNLAQDVVKRKSINFTNVRLRPKDNDTKFYDISNISATYAYNETNSHDTNTEYEIDKDFRGVLAYNFSNRPKAIEPFKKAKALNGSLFKLIKDFNFYLSPSQLSYRMEMTRDYTETQLRNVSNPDYLIPVTVSKNFKWNRYFNLSYNLTKNLKFDFSSTTNARIDETEGVVDKEDKDAYEEWKETVLENIQKGGRTTNYQHSFNASYTLPINKLPMLDWTNSTLRYSGTYTWETAPNSTDSSIDWGNTISNSNSINASEQLNFTSLYNKSKYLKGLSRKYNNNSRGSQKRPTKKTVRYQKDNVELQKGTSYIINHKLKTTQIRVRVFDKNGRSVRGEVIPINESKAEFVPAADYADARVMVTGTVEEKNTLFSTITDYTAMVLTGIKNFSGTYTETNGTVLPGFLPGADWLGSSNYEGLNAPGWSFISGMQDRNYAMRAAERGWLTSDTINDAFIMTHQENYTFKTTIEPIKGLRIDLTASHRFSKNMSEYYYESDGEFDAYNTREYGSFTTTFNAIGTTFSKVSKSGSYNSEVYEKFLDNRSVISSRLANQRKEIIGNGYDPETGENYLPGGGDAKNGYGLTSQEVLIPAFLSAYSGSDPDNIFIDLFPTLLNMHPNWKISYDGLSKIKPFKDWMRSFSISHSYRSTYSVGSYSTETDYEVGTGGIGWVRETSGGNFLPEYNVTAVTITEALSPLLSFNITWKNSLTTSAEVNKKRTINLSLTNNQVVENYTDEIVFGVGYRFSKMDLILSGKRGQKKYSSDLDLRFDLSLRDNMAILREIEDEVSQVTSGQKITTMSLTADYVLSERFNMQLYYDRAVSNPYISTSYPTTTSNFGVSFRFSLTQ